MLARGYERGIFVRTIETDTSGAAIIDEFLQTCKVIDDSLCPAERFLRPSDRCAFRPGVGSSRADLSAERCADEPRIAAQSLDNVIVPIKVKIRRWNIFGEKHRDVIAAAIVVIRSVQRLVQVANEMDDEPQGVGAAAFAVATGTT